MCTVLQILGGSDFEYCAIRRIYAIVFCFIFRNFLFIEYAFKIILGYVFRISGYRFTYH